MDPATLWTVWRNVNSSWKVVSYACSVHSDEGREAQVNTGHDYDEAQTFLARFVARVERTNPRDTTAASHRG